MLIVCHSCESKILVADNAGGQQGRCPKCTVVFTIPSTTPADEGITAAPSEGRVSVGPPPRRADDEDHVQPASRRSWGDDDNDDADDDDDDDRGLRRLRRLRHQGAEDVGLSLSSMIVGIVAVFSATCFAVMCGLFSTPVTGICGVTAVVLGIVGMRRGGRHYAIIGITLGSVAMLLAASCGLFGGAMVVHLMNQ
jgi:hypothetical protein